MGQLSLSADQTTLTSVESGKLQTDDGSIERLHGKKLSTELHIVLENITNGFKRPNVLDLKLGAQLWDEASKPEKRARLDNVSAETTSGSLGFRIAGMRTHKGDAVPDLSEDLKEFIELDKDGGYWIYNKMYGRKFSASDVDEGFVSYLFPGSKSHAELERAREVLAFFLGEVKEEGADLWAGFRRRSRIRPGSVSEAKPNPRGFRPTWRRMTSPSGWSTLFCCEGVVLIAPSGASPAVSALVICCVLSVAMFVAGLDYETARGKKL